jgi:hypothetical protein
MPSFENGELLLERQVLLERVAARAKELTSQK